MHLYLVMAFALETLYKDQVHRCHACQKFFKHRLTILSVFMHQCPTGIGADQHLSGAGGSMALTMPLTSPLQNPPPPPLSSIVLGCVSKELERRDRAE